MALYSGIRQEHWLRDKQDGGALVVLEDGSIWEIDPSDRVQTMIRGISIECRQPAA